MPNSAAEWKLRRIMDEAVASGNIEKAFAIRDLLYPPLSQPGPLADASPNSALTPDETREILSLKRQLVSDHNVSAIANDPVSKIPKSKPMDGKPSLEPREEPGLFDKFRDVLNSNGIVRSAISPLFGLQYKHPEDAPRNIAGGVAEATGSPMAGEAADVVTQFIPGIAAINAYDNGRIPGVLDFTGAMNPLKWTKAEKVLTTLGGLGDLAMRWLNSIPKRDNQ